VSLGESDTQFRFLSGLVSQVGLLEAIVVHEVLFVSGSFHLELIGSVEIFGVWSFQFVWEIVSFLVFLK
jgi:hypothetical protein